MVLLHIYMCAMCMPCACGCQKRMPDSLVLSRRVGTRIWAWVLPKSRQCLTAEPSPALKLSFSKWSSFTFEVNIDCTGSVSLSLGIRFGEVQGGYKCYHWTVLNWVYGVVRTININFQKHLFIAYGHVEVKGQFAGVGSFLLSCCC